MDQHGGPHRDVQHPDGSHTNFQSIINDILHIHFQDFYSILTRVISVERYPLQNHLPNSVSCRQRSCVNIQECLEPQMKLGVLSRGIHRFFRTRDSKTKEQEKRKRYYSGKKKKHTIKTQYMVNSEGTILHKTDHKRFSL